MSKKVLLIGSGLMAGEYLKVLRHLNCDITVVGNSQKGTDAFNEKHDASAISGGIGKYIKENSLQDFSHFIITVNFRFLGEVLEDLLEAGASNILVEKPGFLTWEQAKELNIKIANKNVVIAYNRRFYQSYQSLKELISKDGGLQSFRFEFSEWGHVIEASDKDDIEKENWLLGNSSHVIDSAFHIGGWPKEMESKTQGELSWHSKGKVFVGSGVTLNNVLFSYHSNWDGPGRWEQEFVTENFRFVLKPMEKLQVIKKGSVAVTELEGIDYTNDTNFKPGLLVQVESFFSGENENFSSYEEMLDHQKVYETIIDGGSL